MSLVVLSEGFPPAYARPICDRYVCRATAGPADPADARGRQQALGSFPRTRLSMMHRTAIRSYAGWLVALALVFLAAPAQAQFQPRPISEPPTGEQYHIEAAAGMWFPTATMSVSSESLGIIGSTIDFKTDLGLQDHNVPDLRLVLSPSRRNKFRFEFMPIKYESTGTLKRTIIFNGQRYDLGLPVNSVLDWKSYLIGLRVRFHLERSRLRRVCRRSQVHGRDGQPDQHRSRPSSRAPGRPFPPLAASAASTSSRTFPSPASSRRSSSRRISSWTAARTTSTSISTAR